MLIDNRTLISATLISARRVLPRRLGAAVALAALTLTPALAATAADDNKTLDDYLTQGLAAAMQTKSALGGELMKAMEAGGPEGAVAFCNTRATPIAAEVSERLGMEVTRVSDQPRNPANAANEEELEVIARLKEALASGAPPKPELRDHGEQVVGYYPIVTNEMCLKCHGTKGVDISPATQAVIDSQYPADQATGYGEQELRGLFVVTMDRSANSDGSAQ
jgi:nitrate reductase cytochrome c-type subunit